MNGMSELRWNPLPGEWLVTATHRQERTFLSPADFCPLCPTKPGGFPTEVPEETYDIVAFDNLFNFSFPYMMVMHQRATDGGSYDHYHFHIEFYPPLRAANRLKYLAGSEVGAGLFINDTLAEEKASELRSHIEPVVWKEQVRHVD